MMKHLSQMAANAATIKASLEHSHIISALLVFKFLLKDVWIFMGQAVSLAIRHPIISREIFLHT